MQGMAVHLNGTVVGCYISTARSCSFALQPGHIHRLDIYLQPLSVLVLAFAALRAGTQLVKDAARPCPDDFNKNLILAAQMCQHTIYISKVHNPHTYHMAVLHARLQNRVCLAYLLGSCMHFACAVFIKEHSQLQQHLALPDPGINIYSMM